MTSDCSQVSACGSPPSEIVSHWSAKGEGEELSEQGWTACGSMEIALQGTASVS